MYAALRVSVNSENYERGELKIIWCKNEAKQDFDVNVKYIEHKYQNG